MAGFQRVSFVALCHWEAYANGLLWSHLWCVPSSLPVLQPATCLSLHVNGGGPGRQQHWLQSHYPLLAASSRGQLEARGRLGKGATWHPIKPVFFKGLFDIYLVGLRRD